MVYWSEFSEDNLKLDCPGGIAPFAKCTVLLVHHKDDDCKTLNEALKYVIDKNFDVVFMSIFYTVDCIEHRHTLLVW